MLWLLGYCCVCWFLMATSAHTYHQRGDELFTAVVMALGPVIIPLALLVGGAGALDAGIQNLRDRYRHFNWKLWWKL